MNRGISFIKRILKKEGIDFDFKKSPPFPSYKGSYILVVEIRRDKEIKIGKLGKFNFKKGSYFYVGSAKLGINRRVVRYFRKRKTHWHIDYLINKGKILGIFIIKEMDEEEIVCLLKEFLEEPVKGFGSSDKKSFSHLFKY